MHILSSRNFDKQFRKLSEKVKKQFEKRLQLFLKESDHKQLNLHKLSGKYDELWSINITGDYRALYEHAGQGSIIFIDIDTHANLYGK